MRTHRQIDESLLRTVMLKATVGAAEARDRMEFWGIISVNERGAGKVPVGR